MTPRPEAIVFLTHVWNAPIKARVTKLRDEKPDHMDLFVLADIETGTVSEADMPEGVGFFGFTHDVLGVSNKPSRLLPKIMPGNLDVAHLACFYAHPGYAYYWQIENDVVFSGHWATFFNAFADNDADLLTTSISRRSTGYDWEQWWRSLETPEPVSEDAQIRAFMPVYRVSRQAVDTLIQEYARGWSGHFECTLPTALYVNGFSIEDIGGDGEFTPPERHNRFYWNTLSNQHLSPGSFVFRPVFDDPGDAPDTLWHPVKWPGADRWERPKPIPLGLRLKKIYWSLLKRLGNIRNRN